MLDSNKNLSNDRDVPNESFDIPAIVQELRDVRLASLEHRHRRNKPPKLPSRKALQDVLDGLSASLFPNRLGTPGLKEEGVDYFVGYTLDNALRELNTQIQLELKYSADTEHDKTPSIEAALNKARAFAKKLPQIRQLLDTDLDAAFEGDPAARSLDEVLVCYPGISAIINYRLAHELHQLGLPLIARIISELAHSARPSLAFYNTPAEVDVMVNVLLRLVSNRVPSGI